MTVLASAITRRLNAAAQTVAKASPSAPTCLECGAGLAAASKATFCGGACKLDWHNRRSRRGAVFHDLYMAHRWDRKAATAAKVLSRMNNFARICREEDYDRRGGRRSWRTIAEVLDDHPFLKALVVWRRKKGN